MKRQTTNLIAFGVVLIAVLGVALWPKLAVAPKTGDETATQKAPDTTTIFFAGDIMLSRNVAGRMYQSQNFSLPFINTADVSAEADISFANLESPFSDQGNHFVEGTLIFNADPQSVAGLVTAGYDVLSTANNHAFDQGQYGIDYTYNLLKSRGVIPTGTFPSPASADPAEKVITKNQTTFGFLSYSYTALNDGGQTKSPTVADFNDLAKLKQDIVNMRGHYADVVIVNMHAGVEYMREPTLAQINFAHAAIDAGADMVIGEHPHWVQTVEQYKGKWIFYSLGNFVFDQMWSQDTREGLTLLVTYKNSEIQKIELKPVIIDDYCCPRWANPEETKAILNKIGLTDTILIDKN